MDVEIQPRPPQHGTGRHNPKTAVDHGRLTCLLLAALEIGGITLCPPLPLLTRFIWMLGRWSVVGGFSHGAGVGRACGSARCGSNARFTPAVVEAGDDQAVVGGVRLDH